MSRPKFQLRIKEFEFNLHELAGSMGDFGTLFTLAGRRIIDIKINFFPMADGSKGVTNENI